MWNETKFLALDFETSGTLPEFALQPWRVAQGSAWATSLATVVRDGAAVSVGGGLFPDREAMSSALQRAISERRYVVGWNIAFDISWFLAYGLEELVFKVKWLDAMLLWKHATIEPEYDLDRTHKKSYSLKEYVPEFLPQFAGYQKDVDFHSTDPEELKKLHDYNVLDTLFTLKACAHWWNKLEPKQLAQALIEAECLPMVAKANLDGMRVDTIASRELQVFLEHTAADRLKSLAPHGMTQKIVKSPLQLAALMYDVWKLPVLKEKELARIDKSTGAKVVSRGTDKEVLHELAFDDPRARLVKEYREALGNKTKFADRPIVSSAYNGDGACHPIANVFGTYTGRLTYSSNQGKGKAQRPIGFALHQMKSIRKKTDRMFRDQVVAPDGYDLMEFDAAGQEFRWMAIATGDTTMLNLCLPGEDAHSFMGARIGNVEYEDLMRKLKHQDELIKLAAADDRKLGKVANLSLQYRTSARRLRVKARVDYDIPMELPQAQRIHATYQRTYPGVPKYWDKQIAQTRRLGYVETIGGRRVQIIGEWTRSTEWQMGSTAINYRIQGTGGDQKYLGLAIMRPYLRQVGAYFGWDLHDGIYLYTPTAKRKEIAHHIKGLLDNLPYKRAWDFTPPIPLTWDCKVGTSWGNLKEFKFDA
jgi:DNA polymerase I-like protein with 3'-5' exonuclease and polymerase domains